MVAILNNYDDVADDGGRDGGGGGDGGVQDAGDDAMILLNDDDPSKYLFLTKRKLYDPSDSLCPTTLLRILLLYKCVYVCKRTDILFKTSLIMFEKIGKTSVYFLSCLYDTVDRFDWLAD
ncbi:hypothetical protein ElyMa_006461700 [Elysia marginata]|uniref:Uncharacterized protein n=1 Tax=Elysia marginata TaxID=1093978 RepID=A0AAV4I285_9GAST|nr:hypothetical protein ElyMa_006461700 [Elysia marginata]